MYAAAILQQDAALDLQRAASSLSGTLSPGNIHSLSVAGLKTKVARK